MIVNYEHSYVEPFLRLVPSVIVGKHRIRAVFDKLRVRPIEETFHEFLIAIVQWTFGEPWWKRQVGMPKTERHVVVRWWFDFNNLRQKRIGEVKEGPSGPIYSANATGNIWSLLLFGWDLYCLQTKNMLPDFLREKLRDHKSFQAARYEIAVAAVIVRAGFEIDLLDEAGVQEKHCEFIAKHRDHITQLGIEAKSRIRPGVLNEPGDFNYTEDWKGMRKLIRSAKKQKPPDLAFLIFIDVNLPLTPGIPPLQKPWLVDLQKALAILGEPSTKNPDPFNALIPTNFARYFLDASVESPPLEFGFVLSGFPQTSLPNHEVLNAIWDSLDRYGKIPDDI